MVPARVGAPLTIGIAVATIVAWVIATIALDQPRLEEQGGFIALRLSGQVGGFVLPALLTPFTAALIHSDFVHLFVNMLMLVVCGRGVEAVLGRGPLAALYATGAFAAAIGQFVGDPGSAVPMIGASGAVSAVIAVYAMLFGRNEVKAIGPIPSHWVRALWLAAGWTGIQLLLSLANVGREYQATGAHIGGFLAGLAMARPLLAWRYRGA